MHILFLFVLFACFIVVIIISGSSYNSLIALKNQTERSWANIDVLLKQRFDEIPQLIEVINQYVQHEKNIIHAVTEARTKYGNAQSNDQKIEASKDLSLALKGIFSIGESYPELKSNEQFVQLQTRVSELENQLSDRREHFNESITNYNTRILQIPDVFFARLLGYQEKNLFSVLESEKIKPSLKVKL